MVAERDIYEKDGAVFRGPAKAGFVNEVQVKGKWVPYSGDRRAPVAYGDHLRTVKDAS